MDRLKLFCIPYAGGSATVYYRWKSKLQDIVDIIPVELAGRGRRMQESVYESFHDAVSDAYCIITDQLERDGGPYALFGHSMGCAISYEVVHRLIDNGYKAPEVIFFSGRSAPHMKKEPDNWVHLLPDRPFIEKVMELGGTPQQLLMDNDLLKLFLPVLRGDYRIVETYTYEPKQQKLSTPVYVLHGYEDDTTLGSMEEWNKHTCQPCHIYGFKGGHFFIHDQMDQVLRVMKEGLVTNSYSAYRGVGRVD